MLPTPMLADRLGAIRAFQKVFEPQDRVEPRAAQQIPVRPVRGPAEIRNETRLLIRQPGKARQGIRRDNRLQAAGRRSRAIERARRTGRRSA